MIHLQSVRSLKVPFLTAVAALAMFLSGCSSDTEVGPAGEPGAPGEAGSTGTAVVNYATATDLNVVITSATINSPPVVNFRVTNQHGQPVSGLTGANASFTIAKLIPGLNGEPSKWQNYISSTKTAVAGSPKAGETAVQAGADSGGTVVDHEDGTYTYTFGKDITTATCPAPCKDASGNPLDVSYDSTLTHRIGFQLRGAYVAGSSPAKAITTNAVYTFRPSDGATTGIETRDIVKTATCNGCHNKLAMHGGGRVETKFCVTCHNPGTIDPETGNTVDFKVMVHKLHRGENLPSVVAGNPYVIWGHNSSKHDFSTVAFPQDVRNCSKCHNATDPLTPQAVNWSTKPSVEACGSCHDNVNFATGEGHNSNNQAVTNAECVTCHGVGQIAGSVEEVHSKGISSKATVAALKPSSPFMKSQSAKFKYNIVSVANTSPGQQPVVTFSVTDPTNGDAKYDIKTHPAFAYTGAPASMSVAFAWNTPDTAVADADFNNVGSTKNPGQAYSISVTGTGAANAVANGDGTYTVTSAVPIPAAATGSLRVALQGYLAVDVDGDGTYVASGSQRLPVKTAIKDVAITTGALARRNVVDVGKCKGCHEVLSLHGNNRTDEPGVCVMCHNPNDTDANVRPKIAAGLPGAGTIDVAATVDGKAEESIDFKRLIHGIHAGAKTNYDGTAGHGFRNKGLVVYGHGGSTHDFSHVRFPGKVNDCKTCHLPGTYQLTGKWVSPSENGILASTTQAAVGATDSTSFSASLLNQSDDLNTTPTAAVCSSCHDGGPAKTHMMSQGALFNVTQAVIRSSNAESCSICHGPGRDMDVDKVHYKK